MQDSLTLTQLWSKATGIYKEGQLAYLKIPGEAMPTSYVNKDWWFASQDRLEGQANVWTVGLWIKYLHRAKEEDRQAAEEIQATLKQIKRYMPIASSPERPPVVWTNLQDENVTEALDVPVDVDKPSPILKL